MTAIVSMHHDVWSCYCGGSGAPAWTLEVVGFDLHALEDAGAVWRWREHCHRKESVALWIPKTVLCNYEVFQFFTLSFPSLPDSFCLLVLASGVETFSLQSYL